MPRNNSRADTTIMPGKQRKHGTKDPLPANIGALLTHTEQTLKVTGHDLFKTIFLQHEIIITWPLPAKGCALSSRRGGREGLLHACV